MERYTAGQIAKYAEDIVDNQKNRIAIDKMYLEQDDSHLWPIRGRFNATKRAIRKARKFMTDSGTDLAGYEYCLTLDAIISEIVNNENNW